MEVLAVGELWELFVAGEDDYGDHAGFVLTEVLGLGQSLLGAHLYEFGVFCSLCCT